jgi:hypothetical protein
MSIHPVEGVHYIFDRYEFLNRIMREYIAKKISLTGKAQQDFLKQTFESDEDLRSALRQGIDGKNLNAGAEVFVLSPSSERHQIDFAIRQARALYHPDRVASAGEGLQKEALHTNERINDCAVILQNDDIRGL